MTSSPIISPAAFVASYAVAFSDHNGAATNVSQAAPLPVTVNNGGPLPVSGNITVANTSAAPLAVSGGVTINNAANAPVPVNVNNSSPLGITGSVTVANTSASPLPVTGSVTVATASTSPLAVSGGVTINNAATAPVPVNTQAAAPTPLTGTASGSTTVGPFPPVIGRAVMLALSGTWMGSVQLLRSTNGGSTYFPLTLGGTAWGLFTGNCCEPVWDESEAAAQLYLQITLTSGSVTYRIAQ